MRVLLVFSVLVGCVTLNVLGNVTIPNGLKLALVPAIAAAVLLSVARPRRQP